MMNPQQTIRIVCMLLLIFAAGVLTGRFTAPKQHVVVGPGGRVLTVDLVLARFKDQVPVTVEEELKLRKVFEEIEIEISKYPPLSAERMAALRAWTPKIKAVLAPQKHEAVDRYTKDVDRRVDVMRRRRGMPSLESPK